MNTVISRVALANYLHEFLSCDNFQDYAPNGLQVEGRLNISKICTAVTASEAVIAQAVAVNADALLVHHGFFWRGEESVITGMRKRRIAPLLVHDLNLYAYHLPLDCHQELGNNACLAKLLQVHNVTMHTAGKTPNIVWSGELIQPMHASDFSQYITKILQRTPMHVSGSDNMIKRIAWCSGAAEDFIEDAHQLGVDAYLSGEISERTYYQAQELNMHYFACGHHATERYGIQALGEHLVKIFNITHQFIDSENPV